MKSVVVCILLVIVSGCASVSPADRTLADQNKQGIALLRELLPDAVGPEAEKIGEVLGVMEANAGELEKSLGLPDAPSAFDPNVSEAARNASAIARRDRETTREAAESWAGTLFGILTGLGGIGAGLAAAIRARNKWYPALVSVVHALNSVKHATEQDKPVDIPRMVARSTDHYGGKKVVEDIYQKHVKGKDDIGRRSDAA